MKRKIFKLELDSFNIELIQTGKNRFKVIYGLQVKEDLSYNQAATELGRSILHCLSCDGKIQE